MHGTRLLAIYFFMNFGEHPRSPINVAVVCKLPVADTFVGRVRESVIRARELLSHAQARMCEAANAKRCAEAFQVGQFARLSIKGIKTTHRGEQVVRPF